jgi:hypothetical protein
MYGDRDPLVQDLCDRISSTRNTIQHHRGFCRRLLGLLDPAAPCVVGEVTDVEHDKETVPANTIEQFGKVQLQH